MVINVAPYDCPSMVMFANIVLFIPDDQKRLIPVGLLMVTLPLPTTQIQSPFKVVLCVIV